MKEKLRLASLYLNVEQTLKLKDLTDIKRHPKYDDMEVQKLLSAYEQYLGFSFFDDDEYPQSLKESFNPPYFIHYLGSIKGLKHPVALLGDYNSCEDDKSIAFQFALELLQNNVSILCGTGMGIENAIVESGAYTTTPIYAVEGRGILSANPRFYAPILLSGGAVIAMGDPYAAWSREGDEQKAFLLSSLASCIVVLPTDNYLTVEHIVRDAIESGKDVFVHRSSLSSKIGRRIAEDGARIIDGVGHLLDYFCIERSSIILPHKMGDIRYGKSRFKEIKLN